MNISEIIVQLNSILWSWPLLFFIIGVSIFTTIALKAIPFRKFFEAWRLVIFPQEKTLVGDLTPFEAFLNALSTNIGNGSIAGVSMALYEGGPGAAFWIFIFSFLGMSLRYAEVFLSTYFPPISENGSFVGGPMIYLQRMPFGKILSYFYATCFLFFGLAGGCSWQANAITIGITRIVPIAPFIVALFLLGFIIYVVSGGARHIVMISDRLAIIKVLLFFIPTLIVLIYHYQSIIPALKLIVCEALYPRAFAGASLGFLIQRALSSGVMLSTNATEIGVGTAAILFGGTKSKEPVKDGIMSMLSVFISSNLVCFVIALILIASGVWNNGQTSLNLTISAYETVFGSLGGWLIAGLAVIFGMGVFVAYSYVTRACWLYLTNGRFEKIFYIIFCSTIFFGSLMTADIIWSLLRLVTFGLLVVNLSAIVRFLPLLRKTLPL